jgi:A/G-specific adenine glycosylase
VGGDDRVSETAIPGTRLIAWYQRNRRDLPWRRTRDPYRIWVSEIMLQQTRAQAAIPYYLRFLERFPDVAALAAAEENEVLAAWSGLGYYSRARNLHRAARTMDGFPRDYEAIRALPGVGPYTAAAIASIAFDLPYAVLDGNVLRVVARVRNDASDIGSAAVRERFRSIVQGWLDTRRPGVFNQAVMELGATVCLPRAPLCGECPLAPGCAARQAGTASQLPVKLRKTTPERIEAELAVVMRRGRVLLWRRDDASRRMAGFWELPAPDQLADFRAARRAGEFRHTITHHHYRFTVLEGTARRIPQEMRWFSRQELANIPLSTTARKALAFSLHTDHPR